MIDKLRRFLLTHMYNVSWDCDGWKQKKIYMIVLGDPQIDWNRTLITKINQVSAMIFQDNHRQGANVIIIPSNMYGIISSLEFLNGGGFPHKDYDNIGILAGRYHVYVVPDLTEDMKVFVCNVKDVKKSILNLKNYSRIGVVKVKKFTE